MSIELPEARIIAEQLGRVLPDVRVAGHTLRNAARMQVIGFINRDEAAFVALKGAAVQEVTSRGNTVLVRFDNDHTLLIAPEYGGEVRFHPPHAAVAGRHQFRLDFADGSALTVWIKSMGGVTALAPEELEHNYMYLRDFDPTRLDPAAPNFTLDAFAGVLAGVNRAMKSVLVGKDAVLVGLSNATFQDVLFRARLHPKRRAADLDGDECRRLYEAIVLVIAERLRLGGKVGFVDVQGRPGGYEPAMGPHLKAAPCPGCGGEVAKLALGGGEVWYCPRCQPG